MEAVKDPDSRRREFIGRAAAEHQAALLRLCYMATLIQRFVLQTHRTTEQDIPERSQGLRPFSFQWSTVLASPSAKTAALHNKQSCTKHGKQGKPISISCCGLLGHHPQAPPNAGSPASCLSIPDDATDSRSAPRIISDHVQRIFHGLRCA